MSETEYALGAHCGITFAGIKAASLVSLKRQCKECIGRYEEYFAARGFGFLELRDDGERVLTYVYNRRQLGEILFDEANKNFLESEGYFYDSAEQALEILKSRMDGEEFPHEIGIFLNYPLDDVRGFIAHPNDGVKLVGYWKVYGDEERKKRIFDTYAKCTSKIKEKLLRGVPLQSIFCKKSVANVAE